MVCIIVADGCRHFLDIGVSLFLQKLQCLLQAYVNQMPYGSFPCLALKNLGYVKGLKYIFSAMVSREIFSA